MKTIILLILTLILISGCAKVEITNFDECVEAGNPVMESYPRQCRSGEDTFVEQLEPNIAEVTGESCEIDDDCETPMEYLTRSSCPFTSKCIDDLCTVVCPWN